MDQKAMKTYKKKTFYPMLSMTTLGKVLRATSHNWILKMFSFSRFSPIADTLTLQPKCKKMKITKRKNSGKLFHPTLRNSWVSQGHLFCQFVTNSPLSNTHHTKRVYRYHHFSFHGWITIRKKQHCTRLEFLSRVAWPNTCKRLCHKTTGSFLFS